MAPELRQRLRDRKGAHFILLKPVGGKHKSQCFDKTVLDICLPERTPTPGSRKNLLAGHSELDDPTQIDHLETHAHQGGGDSADGRKKNNCWLAPNEMVDPLPEKLGSGTIVHSRCASLTLRPGKHLRSLFTYAFRLNLHPTSPICEARKSLPGPAVAPG